MPGCRDAIPTPLNTPTTGLCDGKYPYAPGFLYFPGALFLLAPFRALVGDIRMSFVVANLVIAGGLFRLARGLDPRTRGLIPLLWLSFPIVSYVLEQAWTDTWLVAAAVWLATACRAGRWGWAGVLAGGAFAIKQCGFVLAGIMLMAAFRAAGLVVPFAALDWPAFYRSTILGQVSQGLRDDAFNVTAYLWHRFGWRIPVAATAAALAGLAGGAALALRGRRGGWLPDAVAGLIVAYGVAFFFGKWAFANYYYLLAGLVLLWLAAQDEAMEPVATASRCTGVRSSTFKRRPSNFEH